MADRSPHRSAKRLPKKPRSLAKRCSDKERARTRINIGPAFPKWRELRAAKGLQTDSDLAFLLLHAYEKGSVASSRWKPPPLGGMISELPNNDDVSASDWEEHIYDEADSEATLDAFPVQELQDSFDEEEDVDLDEDHLNSLDNCVIELGSKSESVSREIDGDLDDSSDEDDLPSVHIRLKTRTQVANLPVISANETIHDPPERLEASDKEMPPFDDLRVPSEPREVFMEENIVGSRASIVYEDRLHQLAALVHPPVKQCPHKLSTGLLCQGLPPFHCVIRQRCTAFVVQWVCPHGHVVWSWTSQPTLKFGMLAGDFMLAMNILLSGNDYSKIGLLFRFMNMGVVDPVTFNKIQHAYCINAIKEFWLERRDEAIQRLQGKEVVVVGDGMNDSPGQNAVYCSYSTMEESTKEIINVVTVDKRQTGHSTVGMKSEGFTATVEKLHTEIQLVEFCTDSHGQIGALMNPERGRFKNLGIKHSLDVWQGAKNLAKKIKAAAHVNGNGMLLTWLKDIMNHFWWCCKKADTKREFFALWIGIIHHVCGSHSWASGTCHHDHLEDFSHKEFVLEKSVTHKALLNILVNKRWLKEVHKYLAFRSAADLEPFQTHVLMYASKDSAFSPAVYEARVLLAALDYNFHRNRSYKLTEDGSKIFRRLYKRTARQWSVYAVRTPKTYDYIRELQARIVGERLPEGAGMSEIKTHQLHKDESLPSEEKLEVKLVGVHQLQDVVTNQTTDVQQLLVIKEEVPDEWSSSLDQQDPESLHIKEEEEELWTSQEGTDISRFLFTVKSEDDEEKPQSSQLDQMKTETDGEDCGGPEPARNQDPTTDGEASDSFETEVSIDDDDDDWQEPVLDSGPETEDSDSGWKESRTAESEVQSNVALNVVKKSFSCSECGKQFLYKRSLQIHMTCHSGKGSSSYMVDKKFFRVQQSEDSHMRVHTEEKKYACDVCGQKFTRNSHLTTHMRVHTGEKPFSCNVCSKRFRQQHNLHRHMKIHTGERPFSCNVCGKRFRRQYDFHRHLKLHTG